MVQEGRAGILPTLDTRTKVLGLVCLIAEASFLGALMKLQGEQVLYALATCAIILLVMIAGIVRIETLPGRKSDTTVTNLVPSPLTPDSPLLKELIDSAIHTMCRAVSLPESPEVARLRVFIFRREGAQLECSHYWAPNPVREMVGKLRFDITAEVATKVAVVRAVIDGTIVRSEVRPLPLDFKGVTGEVSQDLSFVLAAPIAGKSGTIWGTIDFDAGNEIGKKLLATEVSEAAMFQLAQHLRIILSLPEMSAARTT